MAQNSPDPEPIQESILLFMLAGGEIPGITAHVGGCMAEAACICLEGQEHKTGVNLSVNGSFNTSFSLLWERTTDQMRRCWADDQEATEWGAVGVAVLLIQHLTDLTVIERSYKGTGFDYWLGPQDSQDILFQNKARLEVSGIRKGDGNTIAQRVKQKVQQTKRSDGALPAYVVIVEFGAPCSHMVKR